MFEAALVVRKMVLIAADLKEILTLGERPLAEYLGNLQAQVLAERYPLAASTGLRNRIAHEYDDVDPAKVHDGLRSAVLATRPVPLGLARSCSLRNSEPER